MSTTSPSAVAEGAAPDAVETIVLGARVHGNHLLRSLVLSIVVYTVNARYTAFFTIATEPTKLLYTSKTQPFLL